MLQLNFISLVQFKNYREASFSFNERIVGICGRNGVGKTNLLDSIYYLCFTKSYLSKSDTMNVHHNSPGFRIEGHLTLNGKPVKAICILRETGRKEFSLNDEQYDKFADHIGKFPLVFVAPDDVQIIAAGSEERRRFLDSLLSQLDSLYLQKLMDYNRVLLQRNSYLKSLAEKKMHDKNLLDVYDQQLTDHGQYVFIKRKDFLVDFIPVIKSFYQQIAGLEETVDLSYESQLLMDPFKDLLSRFREKDQVLQRTTTGIHKDDIEIRLLGQPFKNIASQGQRKSLLFALKLAEFEILKTAKGFSPLLLLDDVFEKLDVDRMHNLLDWVCLQNEGQIFITDTHAERIAEHLGKLSVPYQLIEL